MRTIRFVGYALLLACAALLIYLAALPNIAELRRTNPTTTSFIELRKRQAAEKGEKLNVQMRWRTFDQISPNLVHAVLLSEDDTFYRHDGLDWEQIKIAFERNWVKKRFVYGASTITQQLARTLYLSPKKSLLRKGKEALIARQLEKELSKKRILELYLNVAEWGPGIFGAQAASQHYFQKDAIDLTPDEAVALASILPSPRRWSPFSEKGFMARRRTLLTRRLERAGYLNPISTDTLEGLPFTDAEAREWMSLQAGGDLDSLQGSGDRASDTIEIQPRRLTLDDQ